MFSLLSVFRILTTLAVATLTLGGPAQAADWPRQISADGSQVTLPAKPQRIVSTSVTLTGSLLAIGAPAPPRPTTDSPMTRASCASGARSPGSAT